MDLLRSIIDLSRYATLATADARGVPWASPVYFAHDDYRDFLWVSAPDTRHSRNIAERPELSLAMFDSHAALGEGQGVYVAARAERVPEDETEALVGVFSERSLQHGGRAWSGRDVCASAPLRLYRARATQTWVLDAREPGRDRRRPVEPALV